MMVFGYFEVIAYWVHQFDSFHMLLFCCDRVMHVKVVTLKPNIDFTKPLFLCICFNSSPRTKWPLFLKKIFWRAFAWMEMLEFRIKFHWNWLLRVELTICQHWFSSGFAPFRRQSLSQNQCWHGEPTHKCVTWTQRVWLRFNQFCFNFIACFVEPTALMNSA